MALTKCKECGKEMSSQAKVCPHCGYKPKRTSLVTWAVLILIIAAVGSSWQASQRAEEEAAERARAEAARVAAMTPEQKKAAAAAKAKEEAERKRQDVAVQLATQGAKLLKKSMNNPDAFKLDSALVIDKTGAVCYEFRGQNVFGAIVRGKAALSPDGKRFLTNTDEGFATHWNRYCAGKRGSEYATAIRWVAL